MIRKPAFSSNSLFQKVFSAICMLCLIALLCVTGCAVGGSNAVADSSGPIAIEFAPVKISQQGGSDLDGLMATISGSGVTGGWIEDTTGQKITGSDLAYQVTDRKYQKLLLRTVGGWTSGNYTLKYMQGSETKEFKTGTLSWVQPTITGSPVLTWDSSSRYLTATLVPVTGNPRYRLELWNADTGTLWYLYEESAVPQVLAYVQQPGNYQVRVIANIYESGALKSQAMFIFADKSY